MNTEPVALFMDRILLPGTYTSEEASVEEELESLLAYRATVENLECVHTPARKSGVLLAEWNPPYPFVLCPQADQQGVRVSPTERTYLVETFNKTPQ